MLSLEAGGSRDVLEVAHRDDITGGDAV